MQRYQRQRHRFMWLILTPILIAAIYLAVTSRPEPAVNSALPEPSADLSEQP